MKKWKCIHLNRLGYLYRFRDQYENATFVRNKSIQDHLQLARNFYAQRFFEFNAKRLAFDAARKSKPDSQFQIAAPENLSLKDVSFVVLDATGSDMAHKCLVSIRAACLDSEIILVANGVEPNPKAESLASKTLRSEINLGFAAGSNWGAMEATRKVLCFINDDALFTDTESPVRMLSALKAEFQIIGCFSNNARPPQGDLPKERIPQEDICVHSVVGLCMMIPQNAFWILGGFDTRFNTWEDDDLCRRASQRGICCKVAGGAFVQHANHSTFTALRKDVFAIMKENMIRFESKYPKIRVVAIAKDEENSIEEFFKQFEPITKDWCMLDTGSTDGTVEKASKMGVWVEKAEFTDFADTRNRAIDAFSEGADWIVMLDPDERLDEHTIQNLLECTRNPDADIYLAPLDAVYPDGNRRVFVPKPFMFRASPDIRWIFKVHEKMIGSRKQVLVKNAKISHILALHDQKRRSGSSGMYDKLAAQEPYFTDPEYKKKMREEWPILDYDVMVDSRIMPVVLGPLVSVIIPTYKRPELLKRAIRSVLLQDYFNLEVVVIGDNCPDLSPFPDRRVRIFNLPKNHGAGGAAPRNYGINLAAGSWIAYLDDDNMLLFNHLSSLYEEVLKEPTLCAFSSMSVDGKDLKFDVPKYQGIDTSCVLHHKSLVRKYGWWKNREEAKTYAHDWEFFSRWVAGLEKFPCTHLPTLVYNAATSGQAEFLTKVTGEKA